jgi:ABC-type sugar transport system substrate-binding protein
MASGASSVTLGENAIYVGTWQRTAIDQDPLVASINTATNTLNWLRNDYESVPPDGRGNGVLVTSTGDVYVAFSVDGGSNNYNFAANGGWLTSYGQGGGGKVGVLVQIDSASGAPLRGTFITAVLNSGNTNSLNISALDVDSNGNIVVSANTAAAPRYEDTSRMPCPAYNSSIGVQDYTLVLRPDLSSAVSATAPSCNNPPR